jgi:hypothetical protein
LIFLCISSKKPSESGSTRAEHAVQHSQLLEYLAVSLGTSLMSKRNVLAHIHPTSLLRPLTASL